VCQEPPIPPTDLATREPLIVSVATGTTLHRFYRAQLAPIFFDEGRGGRLNSPNGAYLVLYTAETSKGAFAETFLRVPGRTQIGVDQIKERAYAQLHAGGELRLVKLYGNGLARLGATAEVTHAGLPYDLPQSWSAALFAIRSRPTELLIARAMTTMKFAMRSLTELRTESKSRRANSTSTKIGFTNSCNTTI
jgi:hypothetical protein